MGRVKTLIEDHMPGTYVHSIKLTTTVSGDKQAGFLGNLNNQVCATIIGQKHKINIFRLMKFALI
jgi:hypothetical protein